MEHFHDHSDRCRLHNMRRFIFEQVLSESGRQKTGQDRRDRAAQTCEVAAAVIDADPPFDTAHQTGNDTGRATKKKTRT